MIIRILVILTTLYLLSCAPDPVTQKREKYANDLSASKELSLVFKLDFSKTFTDAQFLKKTKEKHINIATGIDARNYTKCANNLGYVDGFYIVRSVSLNDIDADLAGSVEVAFDESSNFICFDMFIPKSHRNHLLLN